MDLDLRKVRYFVAVAERLHFGRAAEHLHIAQPVLSRQIRALEHELGADLFVRSSHGVALTEAGGQFLDDARQLLAAAEASRRRVRRAARQPRRLVVGFRIGIMVTPVVRAFTAEHPDVTVDLQRIEWDDQAEVLLDGRVDIAFVRLPIAERGLHLRSLFGEPRVVVLPADHELAGKESLSRADLVDEPVIWHPDGGGTPSGGRLSPLAQPVRSVEEKLEHVAAGRGVSFLPESAAAYYRRPDVVYVPVPDLPYDQVSLAWVATRRSPLITAFAGVVGETIA